MMGFRFLFSMVLWAGIAQSQEYVYPVASFNKDGQDYAYLFYQKSLKHIELWLWNVQTHTAQKALLSAYTPAGVRCLPDNSGFSFVDNDRIRIKEFVKRSARSIDVYEPIYDIGVVEWLDSTYGYFSAKHEGLSALFLINQRDATVSCIAALHNGDCLYPVIVDSELFYIERYNREAHYRCLDNGWRYRIINAPFTKKNVQSTQKSFNNQERFDDRIAAIVAQRKEACTAQPLVADTQKTTILDCGDEALAFLKMESKTRGYVLAHQSSIDKSDTHIQFTYYALYQCGDHWQKQPLFDFKIPLTLLLPDSPARLYESLLPLVPQHYGSGIYFVDSKERESLYLYCYSFSSAVVETVQSCALPGEHCFVPLKIGNELFCGGSLASDGTPRVYFDVDSELKCELRHLADS